MISEPPLITGAHVVSTAPAIRLRTHAEAVAAELEASRGRAGVELPEQAAMYLAQLGFESGGFVLLEEPSGTAYEGREDLGNTSPGDGDRFRGRGLIQITGRANYRDAGMALGIDLLERPELAARLGVAAQVAAWYWATRNLAAAGHVDDLEWVTRRINGGVNGLEIRRRYYARARRAFGLPEHPPPDPPEAV